jgi:hypothetical protein
LLKSKVAHPIAWNFTAAHVIVATHVTLKDKAAPTSISLSERNTQLVPHLARQHCSSPAVVATQTAPPTIATPQAASSGHASTPQQLQEHHHASQPPCRLPWTSPREGSTTNYSLGPRRCINTSRQHASATNPCMPQPTSSPQHQALAKTCCRLADRP